MDEAFIARFWNKVDKSGGPDACWPWVGSKDRDGYGDIRNGGPGLRKTHRVAWLLTHGDIPRALCVLHRCDNPPCVNPTHLFLGTQSDNLHDMRAKGRAVRAPRVKGPAHYNAKLTAHGIAEILHARAAGATFADIAKDYGVHPTTIRRAVAGPGGRPDRR